MMKKATLLVIATLLFGSCAVVKEYEKINDEFEFYKSRSIVNVEYLTYLYDGQHGNDDESKEFIQILSYSAPRMLEYFNIAKSVWTIVYDNVDMKPNRRAKETVFS